MNADYRIYAPRAGSWETLIIEIAGAIGPQLSECFFKVPIKIALAYAIELLFPFKGSHKGALEIVKECGDQELKRLERYNKNNEMFLRTFEAIAFKYKLDEDELERADRLVKAMNNSLERLSRLKDYGEEFEKSELNERISLIGKARVQFSDIGYPLKRSADILSISESDAKKKDILELDVTDIATLEGNKWDRETTEVIGTIKNYDKETGWGKFRSDSFREPISFLVRKRDRENYGEEIIESMKQEEILLAFYIVRDPAGIPKFIVFSHFTD